jgi:hypothetical protein
MFFIRSTRGIQFDCGYASLIPPIGHKGRMKWWCCNLRTDQMLRTTPGDGGLEWYMVALHFHPAGQILLRKNGYQIG